MTLVATAFAAGGAADSALLADWAVQPGLSLAIDSLGFRVPTAIAFVPDPGPSADDPLYFVTQLRGEIKVVTKNRSVRTFATVSTAGTQKDDLRGSSQQGLAGICLHPARGYIFVTFTYLDDGGVLRNNIVRFSTKPKRFGLKPEATRTFGEILAPFQAAPAHQIGGCQVRGDSVFVGVGDGGNALASKDLNILLGKVLCLSLDGRPCRDHPFPRPPGRANQPAAYVWAYGLRNPFGMAIVDDDIFVAENGIDIDRFLKVKRGEDHHWSGTDQSLTTGASLVLVPPAVSPVQVAVVRAAPRFLPPRFADHFFVAMFGGATRGTAGVLAFGYDFRASRVVNVPTYVLAYRGRTPQRVLGVAVGPDGLYVVPGLPDAMGQSVIIKMYHQPGQEHPAIIGTPSDPLADSRTVLLAKHSCTNCHSESAGGGGTAPSLDRFGLTWRLTERLNSRGYEQSVARLDLRNEEPYVSFRDARREVLKAKGTERTRAWLKYFLMEPRFDNPNTAMPNPRLTAAEIEALTKALHFPVPQASSAARLLESVKRSWRAVAFGFAGGVGVSVLLALAVVGARWRRRWRRPE